MYTELSIFAATVVSALYLFEAPTTCFTKHPVSYEGLQLVDDFYVIPPNANASAHQGCNIDWSRCQLLGEGNNKVVWNCGGRAVKTPSDRGQSFHQCMDGFSWRDKTAACRRAQRELFLRDVSSMASLNGDPVVPQIHSYCLPTSLSIPPFVVTELGRPLETLLLVQMTWRERVNIVDDVIAFLLRHPTMNFLDLRRQQFVLVRGQVKLVDFDDVQRTLGDHDTRPSAARLFDELVVDFLEFDAPREYLQVLKDAKDMRREGKLTLSAMNQLIGHLTSTG